VPPRPFVLIHETLGADRVLCALRASNRRASASTSSRPTTARSRSALKARSSAAGVTARAHTGRLTRGRIPSEIVYGARKMEAAR
jgi:hypothetical protein